MSERRRPQGHGTINRRADGLYVGRFELPRDADGRRQRKVVTGHTESEVLDKLAELRRAAKRGELPSPDRQTVAQFLARWLSATVRRTGRPSYYLSCEQKVRNYIVPQIGDLLVQRLAPADVERMLNALAKEPQPRTRQPLAPSTIRTILTILRAALSQAVAWRLVETNVAAVVRGPQVPKVDVTPLTPADARRLLAALREHRLGTLYLATLTLGLRQGEVLGLQWPDVDAQARTLRVHQQLQRFDGEYHLVEPKSDSSRRTLPLPPGLVAALAEHRERQAAERAAAGADWEENGLVFTTPLGRPLHKSVVTHILEMVLLRAGLSHLTFHQLRHGAATLLGLLGADLKMIQAVLGHSTIRLTADLYMHLFPQMTGAAIERLDRVLHDKPSEGGQPDRAYDSDRASKRRRKRQQT